MVPIPYDTQARETETVQFSCPECARPLETPGKLGICPQCGYVPRQGAD